MDSAWLIDCTLLSYAAPLEHYSAVQVLTETVRMGCKENVLTALTLPECLPDNGWRDQSIIKRHTTD